MKPKMGKGGGRQGAMKGIPPIKPAGGSPFAKGKAPVMPASNMGGSLPMPPKRGKRR